MPRRGRNPRRGALVYHAVRAALGLLGLLPWRTRLAVAGAAGRIAVGASPRLRRRVHANLAHVMPETTPAERDRIARGVGDCFGRTALELFCARAFWAAHPWNPPEGPGLPAVEAALAAGRGAVIVSGHYGGWEATRAWLRERGAPTATVYRPLGNPRLDALYHASVSFTGGPIVPKNRLAVRALVKQLARGGVVALLVDQHERRAPPLDFMGRPAPTTLVPAEIALRFGVPLIPAFATRTPDGRRIDVWFDAPVPEGRPEEMMRAFNACLARQVRAHPAQYYWVHRRWAKALPGIEAEGARRRARARRPGIR